MPLPYTQRREKLAKLKIGGSAWQTTPWRAGGGAHVFETSRKFQFEGIVAKRLDSPYEPGSRNGAWIKIKNVKRQEFVIGGWTPGEGRRTESIGALLAGYYDLPRARAMKLNRRQKLLYAGKIGTGFSDSVLSQLQQLFRPLHTDSSPFEFSPEIPRRAQFVRPRLVGEVEFTEWTQAGILRHPSFKGLRTDKDPRDIIREEPID
jgi:bifunctional non-homologous end joining protein LigD